MRTIRTFHFNLTCVLVFVLMVAGNQVFAQTQITFMGRVVDGKTNQPLSFATISIPQSMTGVISNEFGEFQYHIPENYENSEVKIAYLGYKAIFVKVSDIQSNSLRVFKMEELIMQLPEVEISTFRDNEKVVDIVKNAIKNIRKNYQSEEALFYGYYRDYVSPVGANDYRNLMEAAVVIDDKGFRFEDYLLTKFKLEQSRYNPGTAVDSSMEKAYGKNKFIPNFRIVGANELAILRAHDPIRNSNVQSFSFVYEFDLNFVMQHDFRYEGITEVDSRKVYCINFDKYIELEFTKSEYWVDGQIYIDSESFAILKFNYLITCQTPVYSGKFLDLKLEYRKHNDKHFLNYLSLMNYFEYRKEAADTSSVSTPYLQYRELFINKIVTKPFDRLRPHEAIDKTASLLNNKIPAIEGFWENYNYTGVTKLQE